jgi:hypothetical protein
MAWFSRFAGDWWEWSGRGSCSLYVRVQVVQRPRSRWKRKGEFWKRPNLVRSLAKWIGDYCGFGDGNVSLWRFQGVGDGRRLFGTWKGGRVLVPAPQLILAGSLIWSPGPRISFFLVGLAGLRMVQYVLRTELETGNRKHLLDTQCRLSIAGTLATQTR